MQLSPDILLDAMALSRLAFIAQSHYELDYFNPSLKNLILY